MVWLDAADPTQTRAVHLPRGNRLRAVAFEDRDGCVIVLAVGAESALRRKLKAGRSAPKQKAELRAMKDPSLVCDSSFRNMVKSLTTFRRIFDVYGQDLKNVDDR